MEALRISNIQTIEVEGHGYSTYVRIYTDRGKIGTGECIHGGAGVTDIIRDMSSQLIGESPYNIDMLFEKLRRSHLFNGGQSGNVITAITGIEIALWDLVGKAFSLPVYQLLGGKFRDKIRLYADCGDRDLEKCISNCRDAIALGFNALKIDVDDNRNIHKLDKWNWSLSPNEYNAMVDFVSAVRDAVGKQVDLAVDMHARYDASAARKIAVALEPFQLMWLEEPVPPENIDVMREVKRSTHTPICAGENLYLRHGFRRLIEEQAVDIIMPDIPKCCGLSEGRKIANMADIYQIAFAPHNVCGPLGTMASCHVCAGIPNFLVLEWHWLKRPHWHDLVHTDKPVIENGYIALPDKPGIGLELNAEAVKKHLKPGTDYFDE